MVSRQKKLSSLNLPNKKPSTRLKPFSATSPRAITKKGHLNPLKTTNITPSQPSSSTMSNGCFEEMLDFDLSAVLASVSATPQELLNEKIRHHLKLEGGCG